MDSYLNENPGLKPNQLKELMLEEGRRNPHEISQNPKRRFRFTANLFERLRVAAVCRNNQEEMQNGSIASTIQFLKAIHVLPSDYTAIHEHESSSDEDDASEDDEYADFNELGSLVEGHDGENLLANEYKNRVRAVFFLLLEVISFVLDVFGKSKWSFLLAAFLLSAFGFGMTIYAYLIGRKTSPTRVQVEKQLSWIEIVFSLVQLIVTCIYFILAVLGVNNSFSASALPLAFAIIVIVFVFKKNDDVNVFSHHTNDITSRDFPIANILSTHNELHPTGNMEDRLRLTSCLVSQMPPPARRGNQYYQLRNIEVHMPETAVQRTIDLTKFTCYEDLYKEVEKKFNIEGELLGYRSKWQLVSVDVDNYVLILGDDAWKEFSKLVRKIYIYQR